jgi:tRNA modification GTPase
MKTYDTIAAIATPSGRGGVGIVRISGEKVLDIASKILNIELKPRITHFSNFLDEQKNIIDSGLAIYFPNPHSFTGEEVLELQGHGGPVIMDMLLRRVIECGARLAKPGEFSERAFLNDKIDLAQAESIADLIDANSEQAARSATRSLQGEFSKKIHALVEQLIQLRIYVEAAMDFPEEEIDFLSDGKIASQLKNIIHNLELVKKSAHQGVLLKEGMTIVIAGKPNAGKSSLLNALSGRDSAIVTNIEGTTRDVLREHITIDGLPLHIIDTAGLRESDDLIEKEGIRRAWNEMEKADAILLVMDSTREKDHGLKNDETFFTLKKPIIHIMNKIDLLMNNDDHLNKDREDVVTQEIFISAKTGEGIEALKTALKKLVNYRVDSEDIFIARRRHLDALERAYELLIKGQEQLAIYKAGELLAEDLRMAQKNLNEITGEFTSDDLLGRIFSSFCIGK